MVVVPKNQITKTIPSAQEYSIEFQVRNFFFKLTYLSCVQYFIIQRKNKYTIPEPFSNLFLQTFYIVFIILYYEYNIFRNKF